MVVCQILLFLTELQPVDYQRVGLNIYNIRINFNNSKYKSFDYYCFIAYFCRDN